MRTYRTADFRAARQARSCRMVWVPRSGWYPRRSTTPRVGMRLSGWRHAELLVWWSWVHCVVRWPPRPLVLGELSNSGRTQDGGLPHQVAFAEIRATIRVEL